MIYGDKGIHERAFADLRDEARVYDSRNTCSRSIRENVFTAWSGRHKSSDIRGFMSRVEFKGKGV